MIGDLNSPQIQYYDSLNKALVKSVNNLHTQKIMFLKYLSNGYVASASADFCVNIWDPFMWTTIRKYSDHTKDVYYLDQIDADTLVSASADGTFRIWKISTGQTISKINVAAFAYAIKSISNGLVVCGLYGLTENNLLVYNYNTKTLVKTLSGHSKTIYTLEMFSDDLMASGSYDAKAIVWNVTTFTIKYTFVGHKDRVFCIKRLSSNRVASADRAGVILIWDWLTNSIVHTLTGHTFTLWTTSLNLFDTQILISGSQDKSVKFWNISNGQLIQSISVDIQINALAMLKTGSKKLTF